MIPVRSNLVTGLSGFRGANWDLEISIFDLFSQFPTILSAKNWDFGTFFLWSSEKNWVAISPKLFVNSIKMLFVRFVSEFRG